MGVRRTFAVWRDGWREAAASLLRNPLRASLSALAMAVAVATTALVQTGLDGLARSAAEASARAFGSNAFVITRLAAGTLSRRELADKDARNRAISRSDVRFLDRVAEGRVVYAPTAQRAADVTVGGRTFENATINGTTFTLPDVRDVGLGTGRFLSRAEDLEIVGDGIALLRELLDQVEASLPPVGRARATPRRRIPNAANDDRFSA